MKERIGMSEQSRVIIKGYQPSVTRLENGYQPVATPSKTGKDKQVDAPVSSVKILPPKGGTGEVTLKR
jgi:hypothetical protein